jgi:NAD(P)-dependent dehydrogenase (short-subunit alcohol dehydrogenase family)
MSISFTATLAFVLATPHVADLEWNRMLLSIPYNILDSQNATVRQFIEDRAAWGSMIAAIAALVTYISAWRKAPLLEPFIQPDPADPHMYRDEVARIELLKTFRHEAGSKTKRGLWLAPHLALPFGLEPRNIMILGAAGSGKSNLVRALAQQAIERGDRVVLHCHKGDVAGCFDPKDIILINPAHRDGWAVDIGADIDGPAAAFEFACDIIPRSDQPFWSDSARLIVADAINALARQKGANWGARALLLSLLNDPDTLRRQIKAIDLSASPLLGSGDEDGIDKTVRGIISTILSGALTTLRPMAYAWSALPPQKRFSVKRWLADDYNGPRIVIVQTSPEFPELSTSVCGGVLRAICKRLAGAAVPIDHNRRVYFILDEFYAMGRVERLAEALSVAREKGLVVIAALQSVFQVQINYPDEKDLMSDLFQIKIFSRLVAGPGANDAQERMGSRTIQWQDKNRTPTADDTRKVIMKEEKKPVFSAAQLQRDVGLFEANSPKEFVRAVIHYAAAVYQLDWPPTKWTAQRAGFVAAKWTKFIKPAKAAS